MYIFLPIYAAFVLVMSKGLSFPLTDALQPLIIGGLLHCGAVARPFFAPRLKGLAFLVVFTAVYGVMLDAATAHYTQVYDSYLIAADALMGINVANLPRGGMLLTLAYFSLVPQMMLAIWFITDSQQIFLRRFAITLIVAAIAMLLFPCRGNYTGQHGLESVASHFDSLRTAAVVTWKTTEGTITMPSIHCSTAILLMAGFWKTKLRLPIFALNVLMIYSTLSVGRHYGIDIVAGIALALLTIIFIRPIDKQ